VTVAFFIPGVPRSTQTGRVIQVGQDVRGPGGVVLARARRFPIRRGSENEAAGSWLRTCRIIAQAHRPARLLEGPLYGELRFRLPRPKRAKTLTPYPMTGSDRDNMAKGLFDVFEGVLYRDDKQVVKGPLVKLWEHPDWGPGVEVRLWELGQLEAEFDHAPLDELVAERLGGAPGHGI
jgi:Holliday junction resolvase RusA-like endonuclease